MAKNEKPHNAIYVCLIINTLSYSECPFFKERKRYEKEKDP